jgi:hypothetical protein
VERELEKQWLGIEDTLTGDPESSNTDIKKFLNYLNM